MKNRWKIFCCLFFLLSLGNFGYTNKNVSLPDIFLPTKIVVDDNQFYICQGYSVYIYSLKNFSLKKKIGRKGEGPGEFKSPVSVNSQSDVLIISSTGKAAFYEKNGKYLKEVRFPDVFWSRISPLADRFVIQETNFLEKSKINLCNSNFKKIKTIITEENPSRYGEIFKSTFIYRVFKDKIFTVSGKSFKIDVFSKNGKQLYSISKNYKPVPFTKDLQEKMLDSYKKDPITKEFYHNFKKVVKFPKNFPAIRNFILTGDKIYVHTHKVVDSKSEFLIFREDGKFLDTIFLPVVDMEFMSPTVYTIEKGKLFKLYENEKTEEWELHILEIK